MRATVPECLATGLFVQINLPVQTSQTVRTRQGHYPLLDMASVRRQRDWHLAVASSRFDKPSSSWSQSAFSTARRSRDRRFRSLRTFGATTPTVADSV